MCCIDAKEKPNSARFCIHTGKDTKETEEKRRRGVNFKNISCNWLEHKLKNRFHGADNKSNRN